jgi:hypothetical protein
VQQLTSDKSSGLHDVSGIDRILDSLEEKNLISRRFHIPFCARPDEELYRTLGSIGDEHLKSCACDVLGRIGVARSKVIEGTGDPDKLDGAMEAFENVFSQMTGKSPTRASGQMYAGRTLLYEDCKRDLAVDIGRDVLTRLGPPLALVLTSARWITYEVGRIYRDALRLVYERMKDASTKSLSLSAFLVRAHPLIYDRGIRNSIQKMLQKKWSAILSVPNDQRRIHYRSEALSERVNSEFDAPEAGWKSAIYHSPDIMIAASGVEAINGGLYQLVLGELHIATNTLRGLPFVEQHPDPQTILQSFARDMPGQRLIPAPSKIAPRQTSRTKSMMKSPHDYELLMAADSVAEPAMRQFDIAEMEIRECDEGLVITTQSGGECFDVVDTLSAIFSSMVLTMHRSWLEGAHIPRIAFDDLVVARETWRFSPDEIDFATEESGAERFLAARNWSSHHEMPRWLFVRFPDEDKPRYLDMDSPVLVEQVARKVIGASKKCLQEEAITFVEMLPSHGDFWLPDTDGKRYACELRIVAVDQKRRPIARW